MSQTTVPTQSILDHPMLAQPLPPQQKIDAATLQDWCHRYPVLLVDVREGVEHAGEHIPGSICHPLSKFDPQQIQRQPDQRLVLYCQSGRRSGLAAEHLKSAGVESFSELAGGINAWKSQGYPTQKNEKAPISLMRQVQIVAGSLVLLGTTLGVVVSPWGFLLSGFVGAGLLFSGMSNTCAMGLLLAKLPYNRGFHGTK